METLKIAERRQDVNWDYDEEGDVLYISVGPPSAAEGVDLGDGVIVRIDDASQEMVGVTLLGLKNRLRRGTLDSAIAKV